MSRREIARSVIGRLAGWCCDSRLTRQSQTTVHNHRMHHAKGSVLDLSLGVMLERAPLIGQRDQLDLA
jgi:hypothetical protein